MSLLNSILKSMYDSQAGRIRWHSNMWALVGGKWDRRRIVNTQMIGAKTVNASGEFDDGYKVLVRKPHVRCPSAPRADEFYFDGKVYWVPRVECVKCQWHRKSNRSFRFPRCTYERSQDVKEVAKGTLVQFYGLVNKAVGDAESIVRGGVGERDNELE